MILNSILIRRGLLVTLVMAAAILMQPRPADAGGGYFSFSIGSHYPYYGQYWGHRYGGYYTGAFDYYARPYYPGTYAPAVGVAAERVGALKLRVRPKKTDVYVDGRYAGRAGKLDGYPGYLWLEPGTHTLSFYREGYLTFEESFEVRQGMVTDVRLEMRPGEATPPPAASPPPPRPTKARRSESSAPRRSGGVAREPILDLRADGGRVRMVVEPPDASIYLDGRFLGTGAEMRRLRAGLMVDAGEHQLEVLHPQYRSDRLVFRVKEGEDLEVRVDLGP